MTFQLPPLPYADDALAPHMSAETLQLHHGKHHQAYVDGLNTLIAGTPQANKTLEAIIVSTEGPVFNNAAQVWNHTFFWNCMTPQGGGRPPARLAQKLTAAFGSYQTFAHEFHEAALGQFGSGWVWLVAHDGRVSIRKTANADLPMKHAETALLALDVWEHAYYIDHRNLRARYIETFLEHLVNWDFAMSNLTSARLG